MFIVTEYAALSGDETWIYFLNPSEKITTKYGLLKTEIDQLLPNVLKVRKKFFMLFSSIPAVLCCK